MGLRDSKDVCTYKDLNKHVINGVLKSKKDIFIRGNEIKQLTGIEKSETGIGLIDSAVCDLGELKYIKHDFFVTQYSVYSNLISLGKLEEVGGNLSIGHSNINDLGELKKVGGNLNLKNGTIHSFGKLIEIKGFLTLPKRLKGILDTNTLIVGKSIRYVEDDPNIIKPCSPLTCPNELVKSENPVPKIKIRYIYSSKDISLLNKKQQDFFYYFKKSFNSSIFIDCENYSEYVFLLFYDILNSHITINELEKSLILLSKYYPIVSKYAQDHLHKIKVKKNNYEEIWITLKERITPDRKNIVKVIALEKLLKKKLLTSDILYTWGYKLLTGFGFSNIESIIPLISECLQEYERKNKVSFFNIFFENGYFYKPKNNAPIKRMDFKKILNDEYVENYKYYNPQYYECFLGEGLYEFCDSLDEYHLKNDGIDTISKVVETSITSFCADLIREAENKYRLSVGLPLIGEGWIHETELFNKLIDYFPNLNIIHQGRPEWLGRQSLDIYIPEINFAIEYQGAQHYVPIEFFGGMRAFKYRLMLDKKKKNLCLRNNCTLYYALEGYDFAEITSAIETIIQNIK